MTSSDSLSQPDSNQSHSSGDWLERNSQEESLHEQPSVSSPLVNLNITATINCHLNPAMASCSIPVSPSMLAPQADISVPLSQEEVSIFCQQEDGKEALQSVQESGLCLFWSVDFVILRQVSVSDHIIVLCFSGEKTHLLWYCYVNWQ